MCCGLVGMHLLPPLFCVLQEMPGLNGDEAIEAVHVTPVPWFATVLAVGLLLLLFWCVCFFSGGEKVLLFSEKSGNVCAFLRQ